MIEIVEITATILTLVLVDPPSRKVADVVSSCAKTNGTMTAAFNLAIHDLRQTKPPVAQQVHPRIFLPLASVTFPVSGFRLNLVALPLTNSVTISPSPT